MYRTSTEAGSGRPNDSKKAQKTCEHNSASVRYHLTSELWSKQPTRNDACCRT